MKEKLQKLCMKLTKHKFCRGIFFNDNVIPIEYYYKCIFCGKIIKTNTPYARAEKKIEEKWKTQTDWRKKSDR